MKFSVLLSRCIQSPSNHLFNFNTCQTTWFANFCVLAFVFSILCFVFDVLRKQDKTFKGYTLIVFQYSENQKNDWPHKNSLQIRKCYLTLPGFKMINISEDMIISTICKFVLMTARSQSCPNSFRAITFFYCTCFARVC